MKVCIIDDEWICRFIIQKVIERTTVDTQIAQFVNGQEAFDFISNENSKPWSLPGLIFLDINMPIVNGWQFLNLLQGLEPNGYNPSIYITSSSQDPDDLARAKTYPAISGYISKPVTQKVLEKIFYDLDQYRLKPKPVRDLASAVSAAR